MQRAEPEWGTGEDTRPAFTITRATERDLAELCNVCARVWR